MGARIMTDPGGWTEGTDAIRGLDAILITHEHSDHLHIPSLKNLIVNNPGVRVITNTAVGMLLEKEGIAYEIVEEGQSGAVKDIAIEGCGNTHAEIYGAFGQVQNTGYFIANTLYYPGDSFFDPGKPVDILALPVCGPWLRIKDAIDFAKMIKPRVCFPVHDGMLKHIGPFHSVPGKILEGAGISFVPMLSGDSKDL